MKKQAKKLVAHPQEVARSRRPWKAVWLAVLLFGFGHVPSAWANLNCWGQVVQIKKWPNSLKGKGYIGVFFELTDGSRRTWLLCSTRPDLHNPDTTVEDCNHVFSLLAIAKGMGGTVVLTFSSNETMPNDAGGTGATTCKEIGQWNPGVISHFSLMSVE